MIRNLSITNKGDYKQMLLLLIVAFVVLGIAQDLWHAYLKNYHFYWYESLLFKSYWLCFFPIIWKMTNWSLPKSKIRIVFYILISSILQLALTTIFIDVFAKIFFYAPFRWQNTLNYLFKQHFVETLLIYGVTFAFITFKSRTTKEITQAKFIIVTKDKKRIPIRVEEIFFIQADRPYIAIYTTEDRFLKSTSLKQILAAIHHPDFIRIHKSTIINISHVKSYTSRQNGDYDIVMKNDVVLRLSRTYVKAFKEKIAVTRYS